MGVVADPPAPGPPLGHTLAPDHVTVCQSSAAPAHWASGASAPARKCCAMARQSTGARLQCGWAEPGTGQCGRRTDKPLPDGDGRQACRSFHCPKIEYAGSGSGGGRFSAIVLDGHPGVWYTVVALIEISIARVVAPHIALRRCLSAIQRARTRDLWPTPCRRIPWESAFLLCRPAEGHKVHHKKEGAK